MITPHHGKLVRCANFFNSLIKLIQFVNDVTAGYDITTVSIWKGKEM